MRAISFPYLVLLLLPNVTSAVLALSTLLPRLTLRILLHLANSLKEHPISSSPFVSHSSLNHPPPTHSLQPSHPPRRSPFHPNHPLSRPELLLPHLRISHQAQALGRWVRSQGSLLLSPFHQRVVHLSLPSRWARIPPFLGRDDCSPLFQDQVYLPPLHHDDLSLPHQHRVEQGVVLVRRRQVRLFTRSLLGIGRSGRSARRRCRRSLG